MGIFDGVQEDIEPKEFFEEVLAGAFERDMGSAEISGMEGTVLKVIFSIDDVTYGLTITDASKIDITEGGVDDPDTEMTLSKSGWKMAVSGVLGNSLDMFTDFTKMADRNRYDLVKELKGKLSLTLERPDAEPFQSQARFHSADEPAVDMIVDVQTWQEIMDGTTQAAMAFMGGKMKVAGDMSFAMQLNGLM